MEKYLVNEETETVVSAIDGRTLYFGFDDFIKKIVRGRCCFICGAEPGSKPFNNEHVIPNWILKRYGTQGSFMILPNNTTIKNSIYKIPCCKNCNAELGRELEEDISKLLQKSYDEVWEELHEDESLYLKIFHWVTLIFFKTHLKDTLLLAERDKRKSSGTIGDTYCWHGLHNVHNIVRHHHTGAKIAPNVYGTILVLPSLVEREKEEFDYLDNLGSQTVMIQVGQVVILVVINDSKACVSSSKSFLDRITGPLSSVQIRELFARMRYLNENLKRRPTFYSSFGNSGYKIGVRRPRKIEVLGDSQEKVSLFKLMKLYIEPLLPKTIPNRNDIVKDLEEGRAQYIFDENFQFFQHKSYKELHESKVEVQ